MKMMYISHPFTGNEKENAAGAKRVKKALQLAYPNICFINPLDEFGDNDKLDYCAALSLAMEILSRCDGVIFCRNWEKSTGCKAEMAYAKKAGMEIKYLSDYGITADDAVSDSDTKEKSDIIKDIIQQAKNFPLPKYKITFLNNNEVKDKKRKKKKNGRDNKCRTTE